MAKHSAHATQHGQTGEQDPTSHGHRTHSTTSARSDEQEPSGQGHRTYNTTHVACTLVTRSQVAKDTAHSTQYTERVHW